MIKTAPIRYEAIPVNGGLDLITPLLETPPGVCRAAINHEAATTGGATRIKGYERLDGRPAPSAAVYHILTVAGNTIPAIGATITGAISGATGVLLAQTIGTFVLSKVTGTFNGTEGLLVSGSTVATQTGFAGAADEAQSAQYTALAANLYRADIGAVPGSGPVRGAFCYQDAIYAFRDNVGATASVMYKATTGGWSAVAFLNEVLFTAGGNVAPADGATLTQGAVTATVSRVVRRSGAWVGTPGTAAGALIIGASMGGSFAAGAATLTGGVNITLSGAPAAIAMLPGGKFDFEEANFSGAAATTRVYGCDGKNRGWEWDGTTFVPITTGQATDTPTFVAVQKEQLFWAFGASLQHSAPGLPYDYTAISGASEIATGDTITGMLVQPGAQTTATMAVFQAKNTLMLYGTGVSNWNLTLFNTGTGAFAWTQQNMSQTYFMDRYGVAGLATTLNFGNFEQATLTVKIQPLILQLQSLVACSTLCRSKSQYRIFFSNGMGLYLTIVNVGYFSSVTGYVMSDNTSGYMGAMPVWFPITGGVFQAWSGSYASGEELILLCGADGFLYRAEKGTSFDGAAIGASITLHHDSMKSPRVVKRYRKCAVELQGSSYAGVSFSYNLGYGKTDYSQPLPSVPYGNNLLPSNWDSANWDQFFWDSTNLAPMECEMGGSAENVALTFTSNSDSTDSYTINSVIVHYSLRRALR